jgi:hypothetical protein
MQVVRSGRRKSLAVLGVTGLVLPIHETLSAPVTPTSLLKFQIQPLNPHQNFQLEHDDIEQLNVSDSAAQVGVRVASNFSHAYGRERRRVFCVGGELGLNPRPRDTTRCALLTALHSL